MDQTFCRLIHNHIFRICYEYSINSHSLPWLSSIPRILVRTPFVRNLFRNYGIFLQMYYIWILHEYWASFASKKCRNIVCFRLYVYTGSTSHILYRLDATFWISISHTFLRNGCNLCRICLYHNCYLVSFSHKMATKWELQKKNAIFHLSVVVYHISDCFLQYDYPNDR